MKLTIESLDIKEDQYEAVVKLKGLTVDPYGGRDGSRYIQQVVTEKVIETVTAQYLQEHMHTILSEIDKQQILNMIVLNSAKRVAG